MKNLQNQIMIYSVDTAAFYNDVEKSLDNRLKKNKFHQSEMEKYIKPLKKLMEAKNKNNTVEIAKLETKINRFKKYQSKINEYLTFDEETGLYSVNEQSQLHKYHVSVQERITDIKDRLETEADKQVDIRTLREDALKSSNKITQFESTLTRTLGVEKDETTTDILVVRAYRYVIFKQIMEQGFINADGEHFQYFTSSAGNIRQKKSLWIKSSVYESIENKLMCGLTRDMVNAEGGMNLNKFNAYTALCNTASTPWIDFDIKKAIVVPDFSTLINAEVDYIDSEYNITRKFDDVEINHVDGSGIYLATKGEENKNFQFRMPFFKGLMIGFDYVKFINEFEGNPIVTDIYGKKHDIIKKGIKYIFTKSQFKMWKMFNTGKNSWKTYQDNFKKFGCEASKCKEESDTFADKPISYQVLQTLNHMTKEELTQISQYTIDTIENVGNDLNTMKKILGADDSNENKRGLEKAISIYPNLINDSYSREVIKENKGSMVKSARAGKLLIPNTKRTYIAPDLFAFAEYLFLGIDNPEGLLNDGEVSCSLYEEGQKLDALRSPHLFREHCVRTNKVDTVIERYGKEIKISDWFITKSVHTSVKDLISKQLMFDCDGDDSLLISDPTFVSIAEKHMKNIVPLQYALGVATEELITNENIYNGLVKAYSKNIGIISNDISKIWSSENPDEDLVKLLCYENNACIDFAKTLWYPERTPEVNQKIKAYTKNKLPYFFKYAKGKKTEQVEEANNSVVNMLKTVIPNKRIVFENVVEGFNYKNLMKNPNTKVDEAIVETFERINKVKHWDIKRQLNENGNSRKLGELVVYKEFRAELLKLGSRQHVVDVLIEYLYGVKETENKQSLWYLFGDDIVRNLQLNIQGIVECVDCGEVIDQPKQRQCRCNSCQSIRDKENNKKRQQKFKQK
jgi:hypothetical protein